MDKSGIINMNETFNGQDIPKYIKSFMFIKGFAVGCVPH